MVVSVQKANRKISSDLNLPQAWDRIEHYKGGEHLIPEEMRY